MSDNKIAMTKALNPPYPFEPKTGFPLDRRELFNDYEEALEAVRDAVEITVSVSVDGIKTLYRPTDEDGGSDSNYYYGEPIVISSEGGQTGKLYIVVKAFDEEGEPYGTLLAVGDSDMSNFYTKEETDEQIQDKIWLFVEQELNVDTITGFLSVEKDTPCGSSGHGWQGLYLNGIKQVNGRIELDTNSSLLLAFDPEEFYEKNQNPLATVNTVKNRLKKVETKLENEINEMSQDFGERISVVEGEVNTVYDKILHLQGLYEQQQLEIETLEQLLNGSYTMKVYKSSRDDEKLIRDGITEEDVPIRRITFEITSQHYPINNVKITIPRVALQTFTPGYDKYMIKCPLDNEVSRTTTYKIEINFEVDNGNIYTVTEYYTLYFMPLSYWGTMDSSLYDRFVEEMSAKKTYYTIFSKINDINMLDYSDSYSKYYLTNVGTAYQLIETPISNWEGTYLISHENNDDDMVITGDVQIFNSMKDNLDSVDNYVMCEKASRTNISLNDESETNYVTIGKYEGGYFIMTPDGRYIGRTNNTNGLSWSSMPLLNYISYDEEEKTVLIQASGTNILRFNINSEQNRFRYYKSSSYKEHQPIQLYKKLVVAPGDDDSHTYGFDTLPETSSVLRNYYDDFEVPSIPISLTSHPVIIVPNPNDTNNDVFKYLLYVKDDVAEMNNYKQTFRV